MENNIENPGVVNNSSKDSKQIAGAIILAGLLIAGAVLLKGNTGSGAVNLPLGNGQPAVNTNIRPVSQDEHIIGSAKAKVVIVEYSDLECPFCKVFHNTLHQLLASNPDVAWVYRHYPIPQLHPKAFHEAEASECAWEQGGNDAFWKYADRVFEVTESNNKLDVAQLPVIAKYVGLDVNAFNTCLASGKFTAKVQADIDDGVKAGVNGTPSSFIVVKGKVIDTIPGAQPFADITARLAAIK
jgi:protein-disulfide isomerase